MNNLKHDIFSGGVVVNAHGKGAGRNPSNTGAFCNVPLEQPSLLSDNRSAARRQFSREVIVTDIYPTEYHEDAAFHESAEPGFATHLDKGWFGYDAPMDDEKLLDKWCRIQM
ncbi:MAG: hypothetical protein HZC41_06640 [Chloroflexi bacterium]|nr:hypothetical protein [Chloroflexota bacterium]